MLLISLCFVSIVLCLYYGERHIQSLTSNGISLYESAIGQKTLKKYIWIFIGILTLISSVRHGFIDTYAYRIMYRNSRYNFDYIGTGAGWGIEYGWLFTCYLLNFISSSPNFILLISALLINYANVNSIQKYSEDVTLSLWMYFCLNWLDTNNGLRQCNAAALTIIALPLLINQKQDIRHRFLYYVGYVFVVFCAMQWHNSVKVCIPMMFVVIGKPMNWKTWMVMFICLAFFSGIDMAKEVFIQGAGETKYAEMYLNKTSGGLGIPRAIVMGIIPFIFIVLYLYKCHKTVLYISYTDGIMINFLLMQSAFTLLGLKIQALARLCFYTYFVYFLIMPKLMKVVMGSKYKQSRIIAIVCLTFYFCYNVYVNYLYHAIQAFYFDVEF